MKETQLSSFGHKSAPYSYLCIKNKDLKEQQFPMVAV